MITQETILKAENLKKTMDAAYTVFKKRPTIENNTAWTAAIREFNNFCTTTITNLLTEEEDKKQEILDNFDTYKVCSQCGLELLFLVKEDEFIEHLDFVKDFPGWCYSCLLEHCLSTDCKDCAITPRPFNCPFDKIKKLHTK
jgi:hypothetical protein